MVCKCFRWQGFDVCSACLVHSVTPSPVPLSCFFAELQKLTCFLSDPAMQGQFLAKIAALARQNRSFRKTSHSDCVLINKQAFHDEQFWNFKKFNVVRRGKNLVLQCIDDSFCEPEKAEGARFLRVVHRPLCTTLQPYRSSAVPLHKSAWCVCSSV